MITIHADELRPGDVVRAGVIKGDRERPVAVPVDVAIALEEGGLLVVDPSS